MGTDIYSPLKPLWHLDRLSALRRGERPRPVHVQLILSDLCNQSCHFCAYRMETGLSNELFVGESPRAAFGENNPIRRIPTDKALEIVEDCAEMGVKAIQFTGGGEPTVHPGHLQIMGLAISLGIEAALVTNGVRLDGTSEVMQAMKWIRVSVDAGNVGDYVKVRRVPEGHWGKMWDNVSTLAKTYKGVLGVGFVVTEENYKGIGNAAWLAKEAGAANIRIGSVFSSTGKAYYTDDVVEAAATGIRLAKHDYDDESFEVINLFNRRLGDLDMGSPEDAMCYYQYLTVYIGGDLNVYRCCNTAYTLAGKVGSLKDQRFKDAMLAYEPFDARSCRYCQFIAQNKAAKSLVEEPQHVNFV